MKVLVCGDVVGKSGRNVVEKFLPELKKNKEIDFVILNGENAAGGFGINKSICKSFYDLGVDVITTGNHIWDQKDIISYIEKDKRLLRPQNYPIDTPGKGFGIYSTSSGIKIAVINIMCRLFMEAIDDPFRILEELLERIKNFENKLVIIVDVHGEATSEKMAIGHFLDGKVTAVVGTHTHVPTADLQILEKGTFFQTDLGMCGDYDSVVGMNKLISLKRFRNKHLKIRHQPAEGEASFCGVLLSINKNSLDVDNFEQLLLGGKIGNNYGRSFQV